MNHVIHTNSAYSCCHLCPRQCGTDRTSGKAGLCGCTSEIRAARAALHMWEEPCLSGEEGSGAVFFSGCGLHCVYCQNARISGGYGKVITEKRLSEIFLELEKSGANNINLVTPDPYAPSIASAAAMAREKGLSIPFLCNCSGYMSDDAFQIFRTFVNIWMPDVKYKNPELSRRYSHAADYYAVTVRAVDAMVKAAGDPVFNEHGMMISGVLIRHLVLPGAYRDSMDILDDLYEKFGDHVIYSIMNQYTPMAGISRDYPELDRKITSFEYDRVIEHALSIGIKNAYMQTGKTAKESFIPEFDFEGLL